MAAPNIYPFTDGLGVERFRVEFICESAAEAEGVVARAASNPVAAAYAASVNPHPFEASEVADDPPETAGDFLAARQHDAADGEASPCIGSVCGVGE